jgi:small conductance mechanosensitive channel
MEEWTSHLLTSLLIVVVTVVLLIIIQLVARRVYKYLESVEGVRRERRQQTITFLQIMTWTVSVAAVCVAVMMILSEFGVDITPLLASIGITGLAISLGAQTLIKDFIAGFLILLENQYVVGDSIQLDTLSGQVERITLRVTYVRDVSGLQYIVPNGEVRIVANQNKDWARALADVNIPYGEDLDHVIGVLQAAADEFANNPDFSQSLLDKPEVSGPVIMGDWSITMRVMVKTQPDKRLEITRELQKQILKACEKENISLPYPRQDLWIRESR